MKCECCEQPLSMDELAVNNYYSATLDKKRCLQCAKSELDKIRVKPAPISQEHRHERLIRSLPMLAKLMKLPEKWLAEQLEAGNIPHIKIGKKHLFSLSSVENVVLQMASGNRTTNPDPATDCRQREDTAFAVVLAEHTRSVYGSYLNSLEMAYVEATDEPDSIKLRDDSIANARQRCIRALGILQVAERDFPHSA